MSDAGTRLARLAPVLLRGAFWGLLLTVVATTKTDPDLWGHVRFGLDIVQAGTARLAETYSFTSDREWINHEWAAETLFGIAYRAAGSQGLVAVKVLVVLAVIALLNRRLRAEGVEAARHRDLLAAAAIIATIEQAHHVRPQIFSLLFFASLLSALSLARRDRRWLTALPPLFALWANFHGGWIVGGGVMVLWTAGLAIARPADVRAIAWHVAAGLMSLAATVLNPHGVGLLTFLYETVGFGRADITDWQPVYAIEPHIALLWVATVVLAGLGLHAAWRDGILPPERLLVVTALGVGSFRVNRLLAFFALATLFLLGRALASRLPRVGRAPREAPSPAAAAFAASVSLAMAAGALALAMRSAACIEVDPRTTAPAGAVEFLKRTGSSGRLLVWFDWGQYALWHLGSHLRVSMDGRRETVYSDSMQERHLRFYFDAPGGAALPAELGADYIWLPADLPAVRRLRAEGWPQLYADDGSVVFGSRAAGSAPLVRTTGAADAESLKPAPAGAVLRRCFPGP
ncbi:MAG TPA: hypothetical protein VNK41_06940 [Vicinamibacterales bacterium]|nr:hypothetical protein [Vicinamibacterales bacterium]